MKNYGVLLGQRPTDYLAGSITALPYEIRIPDGNWKPYLPIGEKQQPYFVDSMACVTFSQLNAVETQEFFLTGKQSNYADRFTAKKSGTMLNGNYLYAVADSIRKDGLVLEEDYPSPKDFTWNEYYAEPPQELTAKGKIWLQKWSFSYEFIPISKENLIHHLKHAPLQIVIPGHAILNFFCEDDVADYFDSYEPYLKTTPYANIQACLKPLLIRKELMNQAKVVKSKTSATVYVCEPVPDMDYLTKKASLEGFSVPEPIPDTDSLI